MAKLWHAVRMDVPDVISDIAASAMQQLGTCGTVEEISDNPGCTRLISYFDHEVFDDKKLRSELEAVIGRMPGLRGITFKITAQPAADWVHEWRRFFKPFEILPGIAIVPSWEKYDCPEGNVMISLDPGMAFGTGLHATTRLCAAAMLRAVKDKCNRSLLDVGSGSGILSIVAKKIGFERVAAVEIDDDARQIASENFRKNDVDDIETFENIDLIDGNYDVVVANILLATLTELHGELTGRASQDGRLILSGITADQEAEIDGVFSRSSRLIDKRHLDDWSCLVYTKMKEGE